MQARRFITFIDACYESKVYPFSRSQSSCLTKSFSQTKLFATSEVPIFQVFSDEKNEGPQPISDHMRGVMDDLVRFLNS
jgi:protein AFG1